MLYQDPHEPRIGTARFVLSAESPEHYPSPTLPEIAFAGRSNVGKSSLMNVLMARRGLVRVSRTPGRTRQINFFDVDERVRLVDLPGYGYARRSRQERAAWGPMMDEYVLGRSALAAVVLLVEAKRGPEQQERELLELILARSLRAIVVATKADQIPPRDVPRAAQSLADRLGVRQSWILPFSKPTGAGRAEIWRSIDAACRRWLARFGLPALPDNDPRGAAPDAEASVAPSLDSHTDTLAAAEPNDAAVDADP